MMKEREMEIGYPTDVKHVAHIGWDGPSATAPSWVWSIFFHFLFSFGVILASFHNFIIWVSKIFPTSLDE